MSRIENIDALLQALKEIEPKQKNASESADKIMQGIKPAEEKRKRSRVVYLLRYSSISAAAIILFFFFKQTWFYTQERISPLVNYQQPTPAIAISPNLIKRNWQQDALSEGLNFLNEKEKDREIMKCLLTYYLASNNTITK